MLITELVGLLAAADVVPSKPPHILMILLDE